MADEQIRPPDQVSAGGTPAAPDQGGIIDALRSRGPAPQSALANIQQPPAGLMGMGMGGMMMPPPAAPANLGLAAGSGMLAGLAGHPNTNPYLTQHTEQQDADYKRQQDTQRMMERMQAQREKQSESALAIADTMLKSDDQSVREAGARTKGNVLSLMGLPQSAEVIKGFATKSITEEQVKAAVRYLDLFKDPRKAAELSGVPIQTITEIQRNNGSNAYSRIVLGKSRAELRQEALNLQKSELEVWDKRHPMAPAVKQAAAQIAVEKFGKTLDEMPDADRASAVRLAEKQIKAEEEALHRRDLQDQLQVAQVKANLAASGKGIENKSVAELPGHKLSLVDKNGNTYSGSQTDSVGTAMKQGFELVPDKKAAQIQDAKYAFKIMGNMRAQAAYLAQTNKLVAAGAAFQKAAEASPDYAAASKGDPDAIQRLMGSLKYTISNYTKDPDVLLWAGMESEMIITLRKLGDTNRAIQAFHGAMNIMKTGQYAAIDGYIRNLETGAVAQFDERYKGAFKTTYIAKDKKSGKTGRIVLDPGEAIDLNRYQIMPEFNMPPRPSE